MGLTEQHGEKGSAGRGSWEAWRAAAETRVIKHYCCSHNVIRYSTHRWAGSVSRPAAVHSCTLQHPHSEITSPGCADGPSPHATPHAPVASAEAR